MSLTSLKVLQAAENLSDNILNDEIRHKQEAYRGWADNAPVLRAKLNGFKDTALANHLGISSSDFTGGIAQFALKSRISRHSLGYEDDHYGQGKNGGVFGHSELTPERLKLLDLTGSPLFDLKSTVPPVTHQHKPKPKQHEAEGTNLLKRNTKKDLEQKMFRSAPKYDQMNKDFVFSANELMENNPDIRQIPFGKKPTMHSTVTNDDAKRLREKRR